MHDVGSDAVAAMEWRHERSPFSVTVCCGDHLWEVNESESVLLVHHHIELIEVTVDQSTAG